jgi:hypothetical protein
MEEKRNEARQDCSKKNLRLPLNSLCLCGVFYSEFINHRDTENTEVAQRSAC